MIFRFYLNDTLVDEPVGFDATKIKMTRSEAYHGILAETDSQSVEFYGNGYEILKQAYDTNSIDASVILKIEYACTDSFELLGEYSITFYNSEWYCGDDCYCKVGIERKGCIYQLKNAIDTKVNLDAIVGIDGITSIGDYQYLGKKISIPSKTIRYTNQVDSENEITQDFTTDINGSFGGGTTGLMQVEHWLPFETIKLNEIDDLYSLPTWDKNFGAINSTVADNFNIFTANPKSVVCTDSTYNFNLQSTGVLKFNTSATLFPIAVTFYVTKWSGGAFSSILYSDLLTNTGSGFNYEFRWNISDTFSTILNTKDQILMYVFLNAQKTTSGSFTDYIITHEKNNSFTTVLDSLCPATDCKTYMVNEALSKTSEYITNGCLKVYSDYLGRTDSEPYNSNNDGCGGMIALTKGQLLRQLDIRLLGKDSPVFSLSFNDILKALDCIYGIGYTIEQQNNDEILRVENWEYFYQNNIMIDIGTVSITKKPRLSLFIKNYKTGYSKYEAEETNGLDEFLTEREYSTKLINNDITVDKICQFIASGYAIELTRRQTYDNTKDWRFDDDTFLICTKRYNNEIIVEQGNIIDANNIIDPNTILNYRISPVRMAMNLFRYITTFIKNTKELIFSNGKGNISAEGQLSSFCSIETGVISEKQNLLQNDFISDQTELFNPELHEIENVPLTFEQYKSIKSNPHGLIGYKCDGNQLYGWVQSLEYSFVDGDATFILIPKK